MRNERIVIPRQRLLEEVWGYDPFATTNTIEVFVSNLRRKLEAGGEPRLLHTIRGAGYVLRAMSALLPDPLAPWRLAALGRADLRDPAAAFALVIGQLTARASARLRRRDVDGGRRPARAGCASSVTTRPAADDRCTGADVSTATRRRHSAVIRVVDARRRRWLAERRSGLRQAGASRAARRGGSAATGSRRARSSCAIADRRSASPCRPVRAPRRDVEATVDRVRLFLLFGVLGGSLLALLAGLALSRRAHARRSRA